MRNSLGSLPGTDAYFCDNCGAKILPGSTFCDECGNQISKKESCKKCGFVFERLVSSALNVEVKGVIDMKKINQLF